MIGPGAGAFPFDDSGRRYQATVRLHKGRGGRGKASVESAAVAFVSDRKALITLKSCPPVGTNLLAEVCLLQEEAEVVIAKIRGKVVAYTPEGDCVVAISSGSRLRRTTR